MFISIIVSSNPICDAITFCLPQLTSKTITTRVFVITRAPCSHAAYVARTIIYIYDQILSRYEIFKLVAVSRRKKSENFRTAWQKKYTKFRPAVLSNSGIYRKSDKTLERIERVPYSLTIIRVVL